MSWSIAELNPSTSRRSELTSRKRTGGLGQSGIVRISDLMFMAWGRVPRAHGTGGAASPRGGPVGLEPGRVALLVGDVAVVGPGHLDVAHRLRAADLRREIAQDRQVPHHLEIVRLAVLALVRIDRVQDGRALGGLAGEEGLAVLGRAGVVHLAHALPEFRLLLV